MKQTSYDVGMRLLHVDRPVVLLLTVVVATASVVIEFTRRAMQDDPRRRRTIGSMLVLTLGSVLVIAGRHDLAVLVGWLGAGWSLVLMIDGSAPQVVAARRRIIVALAIGDMALAIAVLIGPSRVDGDTAHVVALLIIIAGLSRSALFPFHRWLVGTITAPTPVSAIAHAGLVSGAGLLLIRHRDLFVSSPIAVVVAAASAVVTVTIAVRTGASRPDIKGSLAWSTVAQMAVMVLQCAVGAFSSAVVHIAGHGMYKAARFLGAGGAAEADVLRRRTVAPTDLLAARTIGALAALAATMAVGIALAVVPPDLVPAGQVLVAALAWATCFAAARGWIGRSPASRPVTLVSTLAGSVVTVLAYFAGLRLVEAILKPDLPSVETVIGAGPMSAIIVAVAVVGLMWSPRSHPAVTTPTAVDTVRSEIRSDVAIASAVVAPLWPLSSFVAVNPLGGLESLGFDDATARARAWTGGRTHLTLQEYRADHARGITRLADLEYAVHLRVPEVCARSPRQVAGRLVEPVDIVTTDLLDGPDTPQPSRARTMLERLGRERDATTIDLVVAEQTARFVTTGAPIGGFIAAALGAAITDRRLRPILDQEARAWLGSLAIDPANVVMAALERSGVPDDRRIDEFRRQFLRLPGWVGHAKWRTEWAGRSETRPAIAPIDLLAVRLALEAAIVGRHAVPAPNDLSTVDPLDARIDAVAARLAPARRADDLQVIRSVLAMVPADERSAIWLTAQERAFDERLLSVLGRVDPGRSTVRPRVQAVFCIDVRSEGFRRHLEDVAEVETLGFAGFFGLPIDVQRVGWDRPEPRCPVLVSPVMTATEHLHPISVDAVSSGLRRGSWRAAFVAAHDQAKKSVGAPFALAEALGWWSGPAAAWRTFRPTRSVAPPPRPTRMLLDPRTLVEQKTFAAESILRTMGLVDGFAPIVLLCGHTSRTTNNPHATALDCGACGGSSGEDNALAVAGLLNAPDVRVGLTARGIIIPDDTWFVAGVHDTASDRVTVLDAALAPDNHADGIRRLAAALDAAGAANAADRARVLPGRAARIRDRGTDWAQIRPEWGLARAASFVIAPRSLTAGLDLDGRSFLHGYDAGSDPDGRVLETIMTAPLIVAHWIGSQYYFSTVDPEVFGAGDKLIHNPVGSVGVISGDGGDLRVGLPHQSTHLGTRRHHQPLRLLAVIQADLELIEQIIARHSVLQNLVAGSWIRIAARSLPHEPWSVRTPAGTWITHPRPLDTVTTMAAADELAPSILGG